MDTISMNCKNSNTSDPHTLLLNLTDKIDLKKDKNMKKSYKNNKF